jgi:hypothetical protein
MQPAFREWSAHVVTDLYWHEFAEAAVCGGCGSFLNKLQVV